MSPTSDASSWPSSAGAPPLRAGRLRDPRPSLLEPLGGGHGGGATGLGRPVAERWLVGRRVRDEEPHLVPAHNPLRSLRRQVQRHHGQMARVHERRTLSRPARVE